MNLPDLGATNHNGGAIHFGLDNNLYVAIGDNANGSNSHHSKPCWERFFVSFRTVVFQTTIHSSI
jgi:glucose/arabinose dehydrogenase